MTDTVDALRAALRSERPKNSGDGYPPALRERVGRWVSAQEAGGARLAELAQQLGVSATSLRTWARSAGGSQEKKTSGFLPVVVKSEGIPAVLESGLMLHTPQGYRVSGLGLHELVSVLRSLE